MANLKPQKTTESQPPAFSSSRPSAGSSVSNTSSSDRGNRRSAEVVDLYKPHGPKVIAIFEDRNRSKDDLFTMAEVRNVLVEYIKEYGLVDVHNERYIDCTDILDFDFDFYFFGVISPIY